LPREGDPTAGCGGDLAEAVERCRREAGFLAGIAAVLSDADAAVAEKSPTCRACGQCCRFEEFGHRLYVSTGELALLSASRPRRVCRPGRCPYQVGSRCTARRRRGLGCRVFFCDPAAKEWSAALYEELHRRIRRLHARARLPYRYVELTAGLSELFPGGR
jgi:hypothetical protein